MQQNNEKKNCKLNIMLTQRWFSIGLLVFYCYEICDIKQYVCMVQCFNVINYNVLPSLCIYKF